MFLGFFVVGSATEDTYATLFGAFLAPYVLLGCWDVLIYTIYGAQNDGAQDVENLDSK